MNVELPITSDGGFHMMDPTCWFHVQLGGRKVLGSETGRDQVASFPIVQNKVDGVIFLVLGDEALDAGHHDRHGAPMQLVKCVIVVA